MDFRRGGLGAVAARRCNEQRGTNDKERAPRLQCVPLLATAADARVDGAGNTTILVSG